MKEMFLKTRLPIKTDLTIYDGVVDVLIVLLFSLFFFIPVY